MATENHLEWYSVKLHHTVYLGGSFCIVEDLV